MSLFRHTALALCLAVAATLTLVAASPRAGTITIRGHALPLHLYGEPSNDPVIVTSGDGGWIHLAPHVAEFLASRGYFVIGFDARAYLASFTAGKDTLKPADEPGDYRALIDYAKRTSTARPVLIGVSEGAGLSLLAATDAATKTAIAGVIGLGLPDLNELGWRWKDAVIYLTHGMPNEPTFSAAAVAASVAPAPLAAIHSTADEYVPLSEVQTVMDRAREPKRLWIVKASNHAFSGNVQEFDTRLLEAIAWVRQNRAQ
jgi:alpha-beta hydrolase superfamily lysophospholipase